MKHRAWLTTALAMALVLAIPGLAPAQVIVDDLRTVSTAVLTGVKVVAVLFIIGAFAAFATGRHWAGGILAIVGIVGMAKADQIAAWLGIGA